jgi:hypothetical protein
VLVEAEGDSERLDSFLSDLLQGGKAWVGTIPAEGPRSVSHYLSVRTKLRRRWRTARIPLPERRGTNGRNRFMDYLSGVNVLAARGRARSDKPKVQRKDVRA